MNPEKSLPFTRIFKGMMVFCALVWVWAMALIYAWPWHKGGDWLPGFPIVASCVPDTACSIPYKDLATARANGTLKSLSTIAERGELPLDFGMLSWQHRNGLVEAKVAAWNFQTTVRYRLDNETPVLVEYQDIDASALLYALGGALFSMLGLYLRGLRK